MNKTKKCLRAGCEERVKMRVLCKYCEWWINHWRKVDRPQGIEWDYLNVPYYVDSQDNLLPDKYLKAKWQGRLDWLKQ